MAAVVVAAAAAAAPAAVRAKPFRSSAEGVDVGVSRKRNDGCT